MIEILFLLFWTILFVLLGIVSWSKISEHFKVYLLLIYNLLYIVGIFMLFPRIRKIIGCLYEYLT